MPTPDDGRVMVSSGILNVPDGTPRGLVEMAIAMLDVSREAMAICAADAKVLATNSGFRQLVLDLGEPVQAFMGFVISNHSGSGDVFDETLHISCRAARVGLGGAGLFVVALSESTSAALLTPRTVRIVRESLERALRAVVDDTGRAPTAVLGPEMQLTSKEDEVFRLLIGGLRVSSIARSLHVSESTVRSHLKAIFRKSGVHSQAALFEKLHAMHGTDGTP